MIDKNFGLEQVRRLRSTNFFAMLDGDGIGELVRMLCYSDSEIIAVSVINDWLENQTERPTPADIRGLVAAQNEARRAGKQEAAKPRVYTCRRCQDCGYHGGDIAGADVRPWEWCACSRGAIVRHESPEIVAEANAMRARLMRSGGIAKKVPHVSRPIESVYRSDFK